jgi:hypothetical protein
MAGLLIKKSAERQEIRTSGEILDLVAAFVGQFLRTYREVWVSCGKMKAPPEGRR